MRQRGDPEGLEQGSNGTVPGVFEKTASGMSIWRSGCELDTGGLCDEAPSVVPESQSNSEDGVLGKRQTEKETGRLVLGQ